MRRKLLSKIVAGISAATLVIAGLTGCGSSGSNGSGSSDTFKVAYISACPFEDGGWGSSCYAGFKASEKKFDNIKTFEVENVSLENMTSTVKQYCDAGVDLIISPDTDLSDAFSEIAPDYPDVDFAAIDGTYTADNALSMSQNNPEIGFVAGVIAALQSENGSVGFVGGEESDEILKASRTMEAGAKYINPDIKFTSVMSGSWTDVAKGKEIGISMISTNKADVIFSFASGVDAGVREACQSADNVYFIAQPSESHDTAPDITVTSIIQSNEALIYHAMETAANGTFKGGYYIAGFEDGGTCSLGVFGDFFDADKQAKVNDVINKIKSGEIDCDSYAK
ncbi:BMP family protein [Eshraghiella crossota]|uniref:BMP family protein n=1 Tax=Eshraghiella crossota TaxID=45851 RepID=UPI003F8166E5